MLRFQVDLKALLALLHPQCHFAYSEMESLRACQLLHSRLVGGGWCTPGRFRCGLSDAV